MVREGKWVALDWPQFPQLLSRGMMLAAFIKLFAVRGRKSCYKLMPGGGCSSHPCSQMP